MEGTCRKCQTSWELFPVNRTSDSPGFDELLPVPLTEGASSCYEHPENEAKIGCDSCGRLICNVCVLPRNGKNHCPACWSGGKASDDITVIPRQMNYLRSFGTLAFYGFLFFPLVPASAYMLLMAMLNRQRSVIPTPIITVFVNLIVLLFVSLFYGLYFVGIVIALLNPHHPGGN